jgi:glycosyltransferase involved in cell wall biosynthesis
VKVLVWQWGRFGAGPRFATLLAEGLAEEFAGVPGAAAALSLARGAEIFRGPAPPHSDLTMRTYDGPPGFLLRVASAPLLLPGLVRRLRALAPDIAVCAMAGPLDLIMAAALRRLGVPFVVLVHDAEAHDGDGLPLQMWLQRRLCRRAATVAALSAHVGGRLLRQGLAGTPGRPLIRLRHPPMPYEVPPRAGCGDGSFQLLCFGRLLPYKGLGLLADSLRRLGPRPGLVVRVVGSGPESPELAALRALPGVTVENRWVPEAEVGGLLGWADAVVLSYREASQSGVAAVALAAGRHVIATNVGGLAEQLIDEPLAMLCEPEAESLAEGLRRVLARLPDADRPDPPAPRAAWREMARALVEQMEPLLRPEPAPAQSVPLVLAARR